MSVAEIVEELRQLEPRRRVLTMLDRMAEDLERADQAAREAKELRARWNDYALIPEALFPEQTPLLREIRRGKGSKWRLNRRVREQLGSLMESRPWVREETQHHALMLLFLAETYPDPEAERLERAEIARTTAEKSQLSVSDWRKARELDPELVDWFRSAERYQVAQRERSAFCKQWRERGGGEEVGRVEALVWWLRAARRRIESQEYEPSQQAALSADALGRAG